MNSKRMNIDLSTYSDELLKAHLASNDEVVAHAASEAVYGANTISAVAEQIGRFVLIKYDLMDELARRAQLDSKSEQ
jgi:hypothetical protein